MTENIMNRKELEVLTAYLCEARSQRNIQEKIFGIDAPTRGGGYETMRILRQYGITGKNKGCLRGRSFDPEALIRVGNIGTYLRNHHG
jgi:hypothetical protein